ncbi:MAG TPA: SDR family NAD(P)-dependent oxidoreductase [Opitutus sp.]|nr:SDR family NAD(P)-dependent oxidoreductase [Opitutus sp.]
MTGGSSGIGKSFIELCGKLAPGVRLCNLSRSVPVIKSEQLKVCHVPCDLADASAVQRATGEVESWLSREAPAGRVLLINNSGFGAYGHFPEPNLSHQLELLDVNIRGLVDLTGRLLPMLRVRGGAVMNIASTAAFQPTPFMATYGASKAFVLHWSLALDAELRGTGVRCLAVCPGPTRTEFFRRAGLKQGTVEAGLSMSADEVARDALAALGAGRSLVVTGWKNKVSAAFGGMAPKRIATWAATKVIGRYLASRAQA